MKGKSKVQAQRTVLQCFLIITNYMAIFCSVIHRHYVHCADLVPETANGKAVQLIVRGAGDTRVVAMQGPPPRTRSRGLGGRPPVREHAKTVERRTIGRTVPGRKPHKARFIKSWSCDNCSGCSPKICTSC